MTTGIPSLVTRLAFVAVFLLNITCALQFIFTPQDFAAAYELSGDAGNAAVRGIGVAFLMWNATYPLFIISPKKHMTLGGVILIQQLIGFVGETAILLQLPAGHALLAASITRFMVFDGAGLALMAICYLLLLKGKKDEAQKGEKR